MQDKDQHHAAAAAAAPAAAGAAVVGAGAAAVGAGAAASASSVTPRSPTKTATEHVSTSSPVVDNKNTSTNTNTNAPAASTAAPVVAPAPAASTLEREKAEDRHDRHLDAPHGEENKKDESVLDKAKNLISSHAPGSGVAAAGHNTSSASDRTDIGSGSGSGSFATGVRETQASVSRAAAGEIEAGKLVVGESTKAGNDLLGGLALGAPLGGGSCEFKVARQVAGHRLIFGVSLGVQLRWEDTTPPLPPTRRHLP